jgi:dipeptidyl aminopeptidase/acylaminoacyl peptidase
MRVPAALFALCTVAGGAAAQDPLAGTWQGHWSRAGDTMAITMRVQRDPQTGRYTASFDSDRLRVSGIPFNDVQVQGCCDVSLTLRGDRTTTVFTGTVRGDSLAGAFREGESEGRFAFRRGADPASAVEEREITIQNGAVTLAGSLLLPRTGNALPAVVFLHGSGAEGRWASRYLATQLATHGIAALIFDKRGVGHSTGDWRQASLEDLAGDGAAAVARLLQEPRIDGHRIGIHGHSQGGTLAPLVAARSGHVAFVIGSAATGVPTDSTEIYSVLNSVLPQVPTAADSASAREYVGELVAVAYHGRPRTRLDALAAALRDRPWFFAPPPGDAQYWRFSADLGRYDPLEWWRRVRVPVLLVYGGADQRVPPGESAARIASALRGAGNRDVTVRIFPGADHTFRLPPGPGGWPVTAPGYLSALLDWLAHRR